MGTVSAIVRGYRDEDLGQVVSLWEQVGLIPTGPDGLGVDEAVDLMTSPDADVVVAERNGEVVGVALGAVSGVVGLIFRVVGDSEASERLLADLEGRLADGGARKIVAMVEGSDGIRQRLLEQGYREATERVVLESDVPSTAGGRTAAAELGGQMIDPGLWESLKGMEHVKHLIERRIILPLSKPEQAARHGVESPRAVVLFGPPGTGKTTFAKGIASRLEWPFVQIEVSQLLEEGAEQEPRLLAQTVDRLLSLPSAVVFVDEVEDIAPSRGEERQVSHRMTTEFLRQVPKLRESPHHLLVCATNRVSSLDPAFLRPGRFDYVLPVGPPDEAAREAIWQGYIEEITDQEVDLDAIVQASQWFTPADIEFAARKAAQLAFEGEVFEGSQQRATTQDFLQAIDETRPSLTEDMIKQFEQEQEQFSRY